MLSRDLEAKVLRKMFVVLSFKSPNDVPGCPSININRKLDFLIFYNMGISDETYRVHVYNGDGTLYLRAQVCV